MSWSNFVFDKLIRDLTPEEENWIEDQLGGETSTCRFARDVMANHEAVTEEFVPANSDWIDEYEVEAFEEDGSCCLDFRWDILTGTEGCKHLRIHQGEAQRPPAKAAVFVRRFLEKWRPNQYLSMKYSVASSTGDGSPGAFFITADRVEWLSVKDWLDGRGG